MSAFRCERRARRTAWIFAIAVVFGVGSVYPQKQKPSEGSQGGYGKVYESAGKSAAARTVQQQMSNILLRAVSSKSVRRHPAVANQSRPQRSNRSSVATRTQKVSGGQKPTDDDSSIGFFKPDPANDYTNSIADALGQTTEQKAYLKQLFSATKVAFEKEVASKGRKNNVAAALTFFVAAAATVYHEDPEPSDQALDNLWDGLDNVLNGTPEVANLSDREKQQMYDTFLAFGGLVLAGYTEGKNSNDAETVEIYRKLAGVMIELILKTKPDNVRFGTNSLVVTPS